MLLNNAKIVLDVLVGAKTNVICAKTSVICAKNSPKVLKSVEYGGI